MKSSSGVNESDCVCRTCLTFACCKARYEELVSKGQIQTAKRITKNCGYFREHYRPAFFEFVEALKAEGKEAHGLFLLIEDPFIPREKPPKNWITFKP